MSAAWMLGAYQDWYAYAACRDRGTALWFPPNCRSAKVARAICHDCPVESHCLHLALEHPELEGIWGGTDEEQRKRIRARRLSTVPACCD
jgi:WhiB family redox-sensing transcriptional regulator